MLTEEMRCSEDAKTERIVSKCIYCLKPFFSGPYDLVEKDLRAFLLSTDLEVQKTDFYLNHSKYIAAFLQVREMLWLETDGWRKELHELYIHRRISEKLMSMVPALVPGLEPNFLSVLSSEYYEGASAKNLSIVLFPSQKAFNCLEDKISFHENNHYPFLFKNVHAIRKQMNTGGGTVLAAAFYRDSHEGTQNFKTVGLVPLHTLCSYYSIIIEGHMHWKLCYPNLETLQELEVPVPCINDQKAERMSLLGSRIRPCHENKIPEKLICLVQYKNGLIRFPKLDVRAELREIVHQTFIDDELCRIDDVVDAIITTTSVARKGTAIIVSDPQTITIETQHLVSEHGRGVRITSEVLPKFSEENIETVRSFSSIDGAIMLDTQGRCHSFGVILDGAINRQKNGKRILGDPSRGAKFNCTKTYVYSRDIPVLGVVISADGMFNVLSNRM